MAPEGKEVEELTGKEILQALRKKVPAKEYTDSSRTRGVRRYSKETESKKEKTEIKKMTAKEKEKIKADVEDLVGTKGAVIFNKDLEKIRKLPIARLGSVGLDEAAYIVAIDGTATPRVIENCESLRCSNLIATTFVASETNINLVSM